MTTDTYVIRIARAQGAEQQNPAKTAEYCAVEPSKLKSPLVSKLLREIVRADESYRRSLALCNEMNFVDGAKYESRVRASLIGKLEHFLEPELDQSALRRFEGDVDAFGWGKRITDGAEIFAVTAKIVSWQMLRDIRRDDGKASA
jgi:hypothetical protein